MRGTASGLEVSLDIVALYKLRMQCEESFRDAKNMKLGLGLSHTRSRHPQRLQVLPSLFHPPDLWGSVRPGKVAACSVLNMSPKG